MAKLSVDEVFDAIKDMSVLEAADLAKKMQDEFGIQAAAPAAAAGPGAAPAEAEAEKDEFTVVLASFGERKLDVIKEVRSLTGLGLKESKELVEGAPKPVKEGVSKEEADKVKAQLEGAGATVELK